MMDVPRARRSHAPRFETLEPRLLLSADLSIVPMVDPGDLGLFLYERSLLSNSLLQERVGGSVVDRLRAVGAAGGSGLDLIDSAGSTSRTPSLPSLSSDSDPMSEQTGQTESRLRGAQALASSTETANAIARYSGPSQVAQTMAQADLVIEPISLPTDGAGGEDVVVTWSVTNAGEAPTPASGWHDAIYFSRDATLDSGDLRLTSQYAGLRDAIAPGETLERSATITLPTHTSEGYLFVAVDRFGHVTESNETNNTASTRLVLDNPSVYDTSEQVDAPGARGGIAGDVADISDSQQLALSQGLDALASFADRLSAFGEFAQDIPLLSIGQDEFGEALGVSLSDVFGEAGSLEGLGATIQSNLVDPLQSLLDGGDLSSDDVIAALQGLGAVSSGPVSGGVFDVDGEAELRFDFMFSDSATLADIPILLGAEADDLGISVSADASLTLEAGVEFGLSFGVTLDDSLTAGDAFFIRSSGLTLSGGFGGAGSLDFNASVGFLDVAVTGGTATLDISAVTSLLNPDGDAGERITASELEGSSIGDLVSIAPGPAPYALILPISAEIDGIASASSTVEITGDAFSGLTPAVALDADFTDFGSFVNIDAINFAGLIDQLGVWFGDVSTSDIFATEVPLTGATVGEILNFNVPLESLVDALVSPESGEASFDSIQTLETVLSQVLGGSDDGMTPGIADVAFDASTHELTLALRIEAGTSDDADFMIAPPTQELSFDYELPDGLGGISTAATLSIGASAVFMLTMGVRLERLGAGTPELTEASRLDEIFRAIGDDVVGIRTISGQDLRVETRDGGMFEVNLSSAVTIGDVLTALTRDGVSAAIADDGFSLVVTDSTEGDGRFLINPAQAEAFAATDLGINLQDLDDDGVINGTSLHGDTLLERFFIRDTGISAGVTFSADDLSAQARFGFLELELGGAEDPGSAEVDLGVEFAIEDTARGGEPIYLSELYEAFSMGDLGRFVQTPVFSGVATAVLPVTGSLGSALGAISGSPRVEVSFDLTDISVPGSISAPSLSLEGFEDLLDFRDLSIDDVLMTLTSAVDFLTMFEEFDFLNIDLPLIDRSVADILAIATEFNAFVEGFTSTDDDAETPTLLSNLEERLDDALAGISFTSADSTIDIDRSGDSAALRFGLSFSDMFSETLSLNLDVVELLGDIITLPEQVGQLLSVGGSGDLLVTAGYALTLDLGLDLETGTPFVYGSTGLTANFLLAADDIDVEVAIGPLGAEIVNGSASISQNGTGAPVLFEYGVVGDAEARIDLSAFSLSDLGIESVPAPGVSVDLPLSLPLIGSVGPITLEIDNLLSSNPMTTGSFPSISDAFSNLDLVGQLNVLVDGLDLALGGISDVLSGEILGLSLPLVGDNLSSAATFIEDFRASTVGALAMALDDDPSGAIAFDLVADVLNDTLGPTGLDFLRDLDGDDVPNLVRVLFNGVDPMDNMDPVDEITFVVPLGTTFSFDELPDVAFDLGFPGLSLDLDADIDLMLEFGWDLIFGVDRDNGFFFDVSAAPTALAPQQTTDDASSLVDAPGPGTPTAGPAMDARSAELFLEFTAQAQTLDAEGTLAILRVLASDLGDGTPAVTLSALFGLDITDPNGDGKLTFQELISNGPGFEPVFDISGHADLEITADFGGLSPDIAEIFPSVNTELAFSATFDGIARDLDISRLEFNEISIDAGALFTDFIFPIISTIEEALDPFDPIVETLTNPVPIISDLRGTDVSLADLAIELGSAIGLNLGWINAVIDIFELVEFVGNLNPDDISGGIPFGSIDLTGALSARGNDVDFSTLDLNAYLSDPANGEVMDAEAAAMGSSIGPTLMRTGGIRGGGFEFPLLTDPLSAFGLLLGQDADLFRYNMAPLIFQFNFSSFFSLVGPLGIRLSGSIGAEVNLGFGYDTSGVRKAVNLIESFGGGDIGPLAGQVALAVIDGFFLIDRVENSSGQLVERTEARIYGSLSAAVELNILVAAAGAEGGITATFTADLNDLNDDGKVRLSEVIEIVDQTGNFACLFEFTGRIDAFLNAYLRVGFPPFGKRWDYELARVTLLSFSFDCELNDPVLASQTGDVLLLHMGPNAHLREFGETADTVENFRVRQIAPGVMRVTAFDLTQDYGTAANPIRHIHGQGGFANDVINIDPSVTANTRLFGGFESDPFALSGDDELYGGSGDNYLDGGDGEDSLRGGDNASATDTLIGGSGIDTIFGRRGPDIINAGDGNDLIYGDQGDDVISGGAGDDEIYGGAGDDEIAAGAGVDAVFGEGGNDVIDAGSGDDAVFGGLGSDIIIAGEGRDTVDGLDLARGVSSDDLQRDIILGGDGVDFINAIGGVSLTQGNIVVGGLGADVINTGGGADLIFGDGPLSADAALGDVDQIFSGAGDDEIRGGAGADDIDAGAGNDVIFAGLLFETADGGPGLGDRVDAGDGDDLFFGSSLGDVVFGGAGADRLLGGGGNDELRGQDGNDTILGGLGDDMIFGDAGDDMLFGEDGVDLLRGGTGNDTIVAGTGLGDQLFGGFGNDLIFGSNDAAMTRGGATGDYVDGGADNDRIFTFAGDDTVFGGTGDDVINTGAGTDYIDAGAGNDFAFAGTGSGNQIFGGAGVDTLYGSDEGMDFIDGGADDDTIFGQGGADLIMGSGGADQIDGGIGEDEIHGGEGDDVIVGGGWSDLIYGDAGADDITGSADGDDEIYGGTGDDTIRSLGSNDHVEAGAGADWVDGGDGDDLILGDAGTDTLIGGADHDVLYGYRWLASDDDGADDLIFGDHADGAERATDGRDRIYGGDGNDELYGQGNDDFIDPGPGVVDLIDYGSGERPIPEDFIQPTPTPSVAYADATGESFDADALPTTPVIMPPALPDIPEIDAPGAVTPDVQRVLVDLMQLRPYV